MEVIVPFSTHRPKSRLSAVLTPDERAAFALAALRDVLDAIDEAGGEPRVLATGAVDADLPCPVTVDDRPLTDAVNAALDDRVGDGGTDGDAAGPAADRVAVVMADLAIATPDALRRLFAAGREADVAIAPGRGGGTNALVVGDPAFEVDYHGASYLDHRRIAGEIGASVRVVDSNRLATDVDEPADLAELLIHAAAADGGGGDSNDDDGDSNDDDGDSNDGDSNDDDGDSNDDDGDSNDGDSNDDDGDSNDGNSNDDGGGRAARWLRDAGFALDASGGRVGVERE